MEHPNKNSYRIADSTNEKINFVPLDEARARRESAQRLANYEETRLREALPALLERDRLEAEEQAAAAAVDRAHTRLELMRKIAARSPAAISDLQSAEDELRKRSEKHTAVAEALRRVKQEVDDTDNKLRRQFNLD
jgi:hypothetical protein